MRGFCSCLTRGALTVETGWNLSAVWVMANSREIETKSAERRHDLCVEAHSRQRTAGNNGGAAQLRVHVVVVERRRRARVIVEVRLPVEPDDKLRAGPF